MKAISDTKPNIVETYIEFATKRYVVNIDVIHNIDEWEYDRVSIPAGKWDYSGVVDSLISYKYPNDKMQAVINNYLLDPNNEYAVSEFHKMQAWRKEAKEIAKRALEYGMS